METTVTPSGNALIDGNILDLESRDLKGHYGIGGKKSGGGCTVGKSKQKGEKMDVILKGILSSAHPDNVKRGLLQKIGEKGMMTHPANTVLSVLELTTKWYLEGESELEQTYGLKIYLTWGKHNLSTFEQFFNKDFLVGIMSKKFKNEGDVPILMTESMRLLQTSIMFRNHCSVIETKAAIYIREHPMLDCLKNFAEFVSEFKECIPKGESTLPFCTNLIHSLSLCSPPEEEKEIVKYIKHVNIVTSLIQHVWCNTDHNTVLECLRVIFGLISAKSDTEPAVCLGSLVQYLPRESIHSVVRSVINNSQIDNNMMIIAIQRIIDWLQWPTAKYIDEWVIGFLKGLASVQKYSILISVTENKAEQIFEKLQFAPVQEAALNIISHMLLSFQHSPDPFHKVIPLVPRVVSLMKTNTSPAGRQLMTRVADLLNILMYLHAGFPELYDAVFECIQEYPKPSPDVIKFKLLESKWTAHRDSQVYVPKLFQQKAEMGKTGLFNLGNTCYMNSILQSIYMCDSFRTAILQHSPSPEQALVVKLQYVFAFLSLSQRPAYAPVNFLAASRPQWFSAGQQQDCSEFLKYLLDQLHEQESNHLKNTETQKSSSKHKTSSKSQHTMIEQNFGGKMTTTYTCLNCHQQSSTSEMFMDLPLAFPDYQATSQKALAGGDDKMTSRSQTSHTYRSAETKAGENSLHLNDLLMHYLKPEKLSGENKYHCEKCGGLQDGERKIKIIDTPEYLILTLLRFSYDTKTHSRSKIFNDVKYPKTLVVPVEDEERATRRVRCDSLRSTVADQLEQCGVQMNVDTADVYSLCSVVIHSGTSSDCGHYYCYSRHSMLANCETMMENMKNCSNEDEIDFLPDNWYLFNDSRVSYASYNSFSNVTQKFTKDTAYVLIYRKIDPEKVLTPTKAQTSTNPVKMEAALRSDLRAAVTKDNKAYLQEQENAAAARTLSRKRPNDSSWYNWKDEDDKGGSGMGPCGGGGSMGDLDTSGARFVF